MVCSVEYTNNTMNTINKLAYTGEAKVTQYLLWTGTYLNSDTKVSGDISSTLDNLESSVVAQCTTSL